MPKNYQWKTDASILSGGYPGETTGIINGSTDWNTTSALSGSSSAEYFYRDSDYSSNANSSRVVVQIQESWTAAINAKNYLTITLSTVISEIRRDDIVGSPGVGTRNIFIRREDGGPVLWTISNDPIATAHTILSTPITLDSYTFTLAPGENLYRGSVYFRNNVTGYDPTPAPSPYVDLMWLGTHFRNILPKDYRPGCALDTNTSIWKSHNRTNGACHILSNVNNMTWQECRTIGGDVSAQGDPPLILHAADANSWYNQKLLGKQ